VSDGLRAVKFAEVVVVSARCRLIHVEQQDFAFMQTLPNAEGRAVVDSGHKLEMPPKRKQGKLKDLRESFETSVAQLKGAPLRDCLGQNQAGSWTLAASDHAAPYDVRKPPIITTAQAERWLAGMMEAHPPPAPRQTHQAALYDQAKTRPPGFCWSCVATHNSARKLIIAILCPTGTDRPLTCRATPSVCGCAGQSDANPYNKAQRGSRRSAQHTERTVARTGRVSREI